MWRCDFKEFSHDRLGIAHTTVPSCGVFVILLVAFTFSCFTTNQKNISIHFFPFFSQFNLLLSWFFLRAAGARNSTLSWRRSWSGTVFPSCARTRRTWSGNCAMTVTRSSLSHFPSCCSPSSGANTRTWPRSDEPGITVESWLLSHLNWPCCSYLPCYTSEFFFFFLRESCSSKLTCCMCHLAAGTASDLA